MHFISGKAAALKLIFIVISILFSSDTINFDEIWHKIICFYYAYSKKIASVIILSSSADIARYKPVNSYRIFKPLMLFHFQW